VVLVHIAGKEPHERGCQKSFPKITPTDAKILGGLALLSSAAVAALSIAPGASPGKRFHLPPSRGSGAETRPRVSAPLPRLGLILLPYPGLAPGAINGAATRLRRKRLLATSLELKRPCRQGIWCRPAIPSDLHLTRLNTIRPVKKHSSGCKSLLEQCLRH